MGEGRKVSPSIQEFYDLRSPSEKHEDNVNKIERMEHDIRQHYLHLFENNNNYFDNLKSMILNCT